MRASHGLVGKDWLGYRPAAHLCSTVQYGMTTLAADGTVRVVDAHRYRLSTYSQTLSGFSEGT